MRASAHCSHPFPARCAPDVLDGTWSPPVTDGSGRDRETLQARARTARAAGYDLVKTVMRDGTTKQAVRVRILVTTRDQERLALAFSRN